MQSYLSRYKEVNMKILQKSVLITGGARGIGCATAVKFLEEGANVIIMDLQQDAVHLAKERISRHEKQLAAFIGDVTSKADSIRAVQYAIDQFGKLDILINNAGITDDAQLL